MAVLVEDASNLTHFVIGVLALFALRSFLSTFHLYPVKYAWG